MAKGVAPIGRKILLAYDADLAARITSTTIAAATVAAFLRIGVTLLLLSFLSRERWKEGGRYRNYPHGMHIRIAVQCG